MQGGKTFQCFSLRSKSNKKFDFIKKFSYSKSSFHEHRLRISRDDNNRQRKFICVGCRIMKERSRSLLTNLLTCLAFLSHSPSSSHPGSLHLVHTNIYSYTPRHRQTTNPKDRETNIRSFGPSDIFVDLTDCQSRRPSIHGLSVSFGRYTGMSRFRLFLIHFTSHSHIWFSIRGEMPSHVFQHDEILHFTWTARLVSLLL